MVTLAGSRVERELRKGRAEKQSSTAAAKSSTTSNEYVHMLPEDIEEGRRYALQLDYQPVSPLEDFSLDDEHQESVQPVVPNDAQEGNQNATPLPRSYGPTIGTEYLRVPLSDVVEDSIDLSTRPGGAVSMVGSTYTHVPEEYTNESPPVSPLERIFVNEKIGNSK